MIRIWKEMGRNLERIWNPRKRMMKFRLDLKKGEYQKVMAAKN
jgi:hypothetical protein